MIPSRVGAAAWTLAAVVCAGCAEPGPTGPPEAGLEVVVDGLDSPVHLTAPPGDTERLFVAEQPGRIRIVRGGSTLPTPFLDISAITQSGGERGLFAIAFDPDYDDNGHFFVHHSDLNGDTRIARYAVSADPDVADAGSGQLVLATGQPFANHNGGQIAFGPDGMLYVALGDGGSGGDPQGHGQNRATLLGSILRLDVGTLPYTVPSDNPFVGVAGVRPEIWAYGLRNPWRLSFDRGTGDLYVADVGQGDREEVSVQEASSDGGENYGWNTMEGTRCFQPSSGCDQSGLVLPVYEYDHGEGCAITGGHVYRGDDNPTLEARYFFADLCESWVRSFRLDDGEAVDVVDHEADFGPIFQISSFGEDGAGELYVVSIGGTVYRVVLPS